jgi:hypothetical protein
MIIKTAKGGTFNTEIPARSSVIKVLDNKGRSVMDTLKLTGRTEKEMLFMEETTMLEVEHSFGKEFVSEDFIWQ